MLNASLASNKILVNSTSSFRPTFAHPIHSFVTLHYVAAEGEGTYFKVNRDAKFKNIHAEYATKIGRDVNTMQFLYDGLKVHDEDTPESLEMEDGEMIDVIPEPVSS